MPQPLDHVHAAHDHAAHGHAPASAPSRVPAALPQGFQPLAGSGGSRLARVGVAIAVLWAAVAWALLS